MADWRVAIVLQSGSVYLIQVKPSHWQSWMKETIFNSRRIWQRFGSNVSPKDHSFPGDSVNDGTHRTSQRKKKKNIISRTLSKNFRHIYIYLFWEKWQIIYQTWWKVRDPDKSCQNFKKKRLGLILCRPGKFFKMPSYDLFLIEIFILQCRYQYCSEED